jgi:hypothetical protein
MWLRMALFVILVLAGNPFVKPDAEGKNVLRFMHGYVWQVVFILILAGSCWL